MQRLDELMVDRQPRILEIGEHGYFKREFAQDTTLLWTGRRAPAFIPADAYADCTPTALRRALQEVRAGAYDLVVVYPSLPAPWLPRFWGRSLLRTPLHPYRAATRSLGVLPMRFAPRGIPLVAIDMHDDFRIGRHSFFLLDRATRYYKRELPADHWMAFHGSAHPRLPTSRIRKDKRWNARIAKLRPMALDIGPIQLQADAAFGAKRADIFFAGSVDGNSTVRARGISELRTLAAEGIAVDIPEKELPQSEFHRRMSEAWLTWSPSGRGWECYRHFEAPLCLSVPVINYPTILRHAPLQQDVHCFFYSPEPNGLRSAVLAALSDREQLMAMAINGRAHVLANHTLRAHCEWILRDVFGAATVTDPPSP